MLMPLKCRQVHVVDYLTFDKRFESAINTLTQKAVDGFYMKFQIGVFIAKLKKAMGIAALLGVDKSSPETATATTTIKFNTSTLLSSN